MKHPSHSIAPHRTAPRHITRATPHHTPGAKTSPVRQEVAAKVAAEDKLKKKHANVKKAAKIVGKKVEIVDSKRAELNGRRGVAKQTVDQEGNVSVEVEPEPPFDEEDEPMVEVVSAENLKEITPAQQQREAAIIKKAEKLVGKRVEIQGMPDDPIIGKLNGKRGRAEAVEGMVRGEVKVKVTIDLDPVEEKKGAEPGKRRGSVVALVNAALLTEIAPEQESRQEVEHNEAERKAEAERLASLDPELRAKAEAWYGKMPGQEAVEPAEPNGEPIEPNGEPNEPNSEPNEPPADELEGEVGWASTEARLQPLSPPNPHAQLPPTGSLPELAPSRGSSFGQDSFASDDGSNDDNEGSYISMRNQVS